MFIFFLASFLQNRIVIPSKQCFWRLVRTLALVHVASLVPRHFARVAQLQEPEMLGEVLAQLAPREVSLLACEFASRRLLCLADVRAFWAEGLVVAQAQEALELPEALPVFLGERALFPRSFEL
jgi:hypothetical protein